MPQAASQRSLLAASRNPNVKDRFHHEGPPSSSSPAIFCGGGKRWGCFHFVGCATRTVLLDGAQSAPYTIKICLPNHNFHGQ